MPASARGKVTRVPSCTSRALLERAAAADAEPGEQPGRRTEAGEAGLQQVQADECGQQVPPGRDEMAQRETGQDHRAGEGEDCAIKIHVDFPRSEEHTSELQSLIRISYAVFCLQKQI